MTSRADRTYYEATQGTVRAIAEQISKAWRTALDVSALSSTYASGVTPVFSAVVSGAQHRVASLATPYVSAVAGGQAAQVVPGAFAGYTAEGMPLDTLSNVAFGQMVGAMNAGAQPSVAMSQGLNALLRYAHTEVADAGRMAVQTQIVSDPGIAGHERVVHLPACDRCIILAGKFYRYSTGFQRHPMCDCTMRPVTREQWRNEAPENDPSALFESMTTEQQNAAFGTADAEAIRQGADVSQVVNARSKSMKAAGKRWTTEGTTARGLYGGYRAGASTTKVVGSRYRVSTAPRPTAGEIIASAYRDNLSRQELISVLYKYAYIV